MENKTLVAYFSASGVTAKAAESLAAACGGDLYEIKPAVPYTSKDLNWQDKRGDERSLCPPGICGWKFEFDSL